MTAPFTHIRGAQANDANAILDIDIKCFEDAWTPEEWTKIGQKSHHAISVATLFGAPIGFGVWRHDSGLKGIEIIKIAVKDPHRRKGISLQLISAALDYARTREADHLFIVVPEGTVYPGPRNVSDWLNAVKFEVSRKTPILKKHFTAYGESEDGVMFITPVHR